VTNPLERLNRETKRRSDVVGISRRCGHSPRRRLAAGAEQWATTSRYMTLETLDTISDTAPVSLPAMAV
jgi:putative transposase